MPDTPPPLPTRSVPCWRCGGTATRQSLRYDVCATCTAMLQEVLARYQGLRLEQERDTQKGDA
jgi:hypothetical protein